MGDAQKAHAPLLALRVDRNLGLHVQGCRGLVKNREEILSAILLAPLLVPEQSAKLQSLLLSKGQRAVPRNRLDLGDLYAESGQT